MMHQGGTVFPNLSVWENLQLATGNTQHPTLYSFKGCLLSKISQLSEVIPLLRKSKNELANTKTDKYSGGERHELALAMALVRQPHLLILDEPSAGLSPDAVDSMYVMLGKTRELFGVTILLIEQNIAQAEIFCNRCVTLNQGRKDCFFVKK